MNKLLLIGICLILILFSSCNGQNVTSSQEKAVNKESVVDEISRFRNEVCQKITGAWDIYNFKCVDNKILGVMLLGVNSSETPYKAYYAEITSSWEDKTLILKYADHYCLNTWRIANFSDSELKGTFKNEGCQYPKAIKDIPRLYEGNLTLTKTDEESEIGRPNYEGTAVYIMDNNRKQYQVTELMPVIRP